MPAGESWPVLLSQTNRLYPSSFNADPTYPIAVGANRADNLNAFTPDIQIARVQTWTVGFARSISNTMAFEIRYIGNRGDNEWSSINYNCGTTNGNNCTGIRGENLVANGFLNEFKQAMANLRPTTPRASRTVPARLRISARALARARCRFTWRTSTAERMPATRPPTAWGRTGKPSIPRPPTRTRRSRAGSPGRTRTPTARPADLDYNLTRRNQAQAVGYPANFFVVNPDVNFANVTDSGAFSKYNALQLELRRRLSKGFSANLNYQYAFEGGSQFDGFSFGRAWTDVPVTGNPTVRHALKFQADWMLPFGRGERFGTDMNPVLNVLASGWSITSVGRFQTTVTDLGNVRLVGMSVNDLQGMYKFYRKENASTGIDEIWMLPDDIILNTRRAFSTSNATVSGYSTGLGAPEGRYIAPANSADCIQVKAGDCAPRSVLLLTPWFKRVDLGVMKKIDVGGTKNVELRFDLLNIFDSPNYSPVGAAGTNTAAGTSASIFRTTAAYTDASNTYDPGGRIGQLMLRFNW